jgi:hypothetical protein
MIRYITGLFLLGARTERTKNKKKKEVRKEKDIRGKRREV